MRALITVLMGRYVLRQVAGLLVIDVLGGHAVHENPQADRATYQ